MKYIYSIILLALITSCNMPVENQTNNGEPEGSHTSAEWQIWAYSTAAPDYIAADASVLGPDMSVLREGTNGWTCLPVNPRGQRQIGFSPAPLCCLPSTPDDVGACDVRPGLHGVCGRT